MIEVSASIGAMIVQVATARGVPAGALEAATGFDARVAANVDARIPIELEERLWAEAAARTGDDSFGLHTAQGLRPGVFDVLDYAIRTAPTLRAAIERLARYNRLLHDVAVFRLREQGLRARIEHGFAQVERVPSRHAAEFTIGAVVVFGGQLQGTERLRVRGVDFIHPSPGEGAQAEAAAFFGVAPRYGAASNAVEIDRKLLEARVPAHDPALSKVIERHADTRLAALPELALGMRERVCKLLAVVLPEASCSLASIAARLKMSERSLQRRLRAENATFDELLDEVRRERALRYLADPKLAIAEVAYLLGYSEPSAFHRAFKRWTGSTPSELRQRAA